MHPKDAAGTANSVDPDQRSSLIWVCTVCPDLSVRKLRNITVTISQAHYNSQPRSRKTGTTEKMVVIGCTLLQQRLLLFCRWHLFPCKFDRCQLVYITVAGRVCSFSIVNKTVQNQCVYQLFKPNCTMKVTWNNWLQVNNISHDTTKPVFESFWPSQTQIGLRSHSS